MSALGEAALALHRRGLSIFPAQPRGKRPAVEHWAPFQTRRATEDELRGYWRENPAYNIACATGAISGFWALDIDGEDGEASLRRLEAAYGPPPQTVEQITGGGGRHLYFAWPADGPELRNSASTVAPNIDVRGAGGFVILPPSVHPGDPKRGIPPGRRYAWSIDSAGTFAAGPAWLLALARRTLATGPGPAQEQAARDPDQWAALVSRTIGEGQRNQTATRLVGHLLRKFIDPDVALELLRCWNAARCRPPLDDAELLRITDSVAGAELRRRGARADG